MMYKYIRASSVILLSICIFQGCTTVNHKVGKALNLETDLKLEIHAAEDINPDELQQASPVFLYLYELANTQAFDRADFIDLYERDQEILGDSLIRKTGAQAYFARFNPRGAICVVSGYAICRAVRPVLPIQRLQSKISVSSDV